jgi:thiamine-phosphate pyrophosphorylase
MRAPPFDLLIVSDGKPGLYARIERALRAADGRRIALQLRERSLTDAALLELARSLRALTHAAGALLLINGRIDIALAAAADGIHLPESAVSPALARAQLGPDRWIGASRHDARGVAVAAAQGADYATLSPIHEVAGKAPPLGHEGFAQIARGTPLPLYALGGVRLDDVAPLCRGGARGIAVMREVLSAADPGARSRALLEALASSLG